jgi:hypothetical protein
MRGQSDTNKNCVWTVVAIIEHVIAQNYELTCDGLRDPRQAMIDPDFRLLDDCEAQCLKLTAMAERERGGQFECES